MEFTIWFAQAAAKQPDGIATLLRSPLVPMVVVFFLFWLLLIRPQRKREKEMEDMISALKKGDKVLTKSGMYGEVAEVSNSNIVVEVAPKVKIAMQRNAVAAMLTDEQYSAVQVTSFETTSGGKKPAKSVKKKKK